MSVQLLDLKELPDLFKCCERKARDLPDPFSRAGRKRLNNTQNIHKSLEDRKCLSSSINVHRSGKQISLSRGIGLSEARASDPCGRRSNLSVNSKNLRGAS